MISMHEISWGARELFPLLCIPVWIFPVGVCASVLGVCTCRACVRGGELHLCMSVHIACVSKNVFNGGFCSEQRKMQSWWRHPMPHSVVCCWAQSTSPALVFIAMHTFSFIPLHVQQVSMPLHEEGSWTKHLWRSFLKLCLTLHCCSQHLRFCRRLVPWIHRLVCCFT